MDHLIELNWHKLFHIKCVLRRLLYSAAAPCVAAASLECESAYAINSIEADVENEHYCITKRHNGFIILYMWTCVYVPFAFFCECDQRAAALESKRWTIYIIFLSIAPGKQKHETHSISGTLLYLFDAIAPFRLWWHIEVCVCVNVIDTGMVMRVYCR